MEYDEEAMRKACAREAPREACGLVFANGFTVELDNVKDHPGMYIMDEGQFLSAVQQHGMFVAIWHTHPNGDIKPSPFDLEFHARYYDDMGVAMIIATADETATYADHS